MSRTDADKPLYQKYYVERVDGRKRKNARYFVLRYDRCKKARLALRLYAMLQEKDFPELARTLKLDLDHFDER